ncbi:MAG: relaxase/mobilization nuclease domain-containing protein, partial [Bacteroidota bacterium]
MVARINTGKSISKALNYNEKKLQQGKAEILISSGFLKEARDLNFYDKIKTFQKLTSLNERATTHSLHISLNFDPSEKLSNEKLIEIAGSYMDKIGFKDQPYLVYRHYDSGHPHIHIVSTNIKRNGKRISMHNMGRNQSETARKEIETEYNLVKAEAKKNTDIIHLAPIQATKILYGKGETRRAISNVLGPVLNQYKFSSLHELNAILILYNITADPGQDGSEIYANKGLTYHVLDEKGNKVGIPQKASSFFMKPTLSKLEKLFRENRSLKETYRKKLTVAIDWQLLKKPTTVEQLVKALEKEHITMILRRGKSDIIFGVTYIDHRSKCVFN